MARGLLLATLLLSAARGAEAALRRAGNVPKGECYECEVTCFEDCVLKYDREIIQADLDDAKQRERAKRRKENSKLLQLRSAEAEANHSHVFAWRTRSRNATTLSDEVAAVVEQYSQCLEADKCHGHHARTASAAPWATAARNNPACRDPTRNKKAALLAGGASQCSGPPESSCSTGCGVKAMGDEAPAFLQHIPLHPVKVNTFATGKQVLEECMKSCLAATCGCEDAPGFEAIDQLDKQIKANDQKGDPVEDTPPSFNFRPATKDECAGGMKGMKVTKGLYTALSVGWLEVCTEDYLKAMMVKDVAKGVAHCGASDEASEEYGCIWNDKKGACVWGLKPVARCSVRYSADKK